MMACFSRKLPATSDALTTIMEPIQGFLQEEGVSSQIQHHAQLMIEETVLNALHHGGAKTEEAIDLQLLIEPGWLTIKIRDPGKPFDPTQHEPPDTTLSIEERPIGGLGVYLTQTLADELLYQRENNQNCLTIRKRLAET